MTCYNPKFVQSKLRAEMVKTLEHCRASPPPNTAELSLPLTFFDVFWLTFHEIQYLLFYKSPHTTSFFLETVVPNLKHSLSLALKHYLPFAGNMVYGLDDSGLPILRYTAGDSIPLTLAESSGNFDHLAGNHIRKCEDFYSLIPELPPPYFASTSKIVPLLAIQITIFPNSGIAIGFTNHHIVGDANVIVGFSRAWASINKFHGDTHLRASNLVPFYDRSVIKDPHHLRTIIFNIIKETNPMQTSSTLVSRLPTDKVRATFVLRQSEIQEMKNYVFRKRPTLIHGSSFSVTCAYIWACWLKTKDAVGETGPSDKEADFFVFSVDSRSRLDPPLPAAYFGNCLIACFATSTHEKLVGEDGFLIATELIGESIYKMINDKKGPLNGSGIFNLGEINWQRVLNIAGSQKYDTYDSDFGWGKPEKFECISIDIDAAMSLNKSGGDGDGLEVGLSMPEKDMKAFGSIFNYGLTNIYSLRSKI